MHTIKFEIGDWSGDGHGQHESFMVESNVPVEEVREAYFKAREKSEFKSITPEDICSDYEENTVKAPELRKLLAVGYNYDEQWDYWDPKKPHEERLPGINGMLHYLLWFIKQGNPEITFKQSKIDNTFHFYGHDKKGRHIQFIGYGTLGN